MIMFAISYNDSGFSPPNCSYSYPETLRLQVPRKEDYYVRDVAVQVAYICPKLRSVAHRLATICDEFDQEFFLSSSEDQQEDPPSLLDCLLNWLF